MQLPNERTDPDRLAGLRVLLAENETVIALDLEVMLRRLGCIVSKVAISVDQTLQQLHDDRPDAVVLSPHLDDGSALPVAEALRRAQIPFVLVKDSIRRSVTESVWDEAPRLNWPYGRSRLGHLLLKAIATGYPGLLSSA